MALGLTEIRSRATTFAYEWRHATSEQGDAQTFWNEFFEVFGISRKRVATFEHNVKKLGERRGRIDMLARICNALDCEFHDIIEMVSDDNGEI